MINLGILGSTRGTSMQGIVTAIEDKVLSARVTVVLSNREDALILTKAREKQIPAFFINPINLSREQYDEYLSNTLRDHQVDYVLLIGYARIISAPFIATWRHRILNIHPSLLPAFANKMDRAVHEAVLQAGITETGCTVHEVTEDVDEGPIILQKRCPVLPGDTIDTLKDRVQQLEGKALVEAIQYLIRKRESIDVPYTH